MKIHKLSSTDAFIAFDLGDAPATGITRLARKVLVDGAKLLARSTTYSFAAYGVQMGGASAGINAEGDDRDAAVAAFTTEVSELVEAGRWTTDPGLGLTGEDFAPLAAADPRPAEAVGDAGTALAARGAVAAAAATRDGGLAGARCAVAGKGAAVDAARAAIADSGGDAVSDELDADVDVLFVAGKAGAVEHDAASSVRAGIVVPLTPVPITARAHAVLSAAGTVHVPDFIALAAPLLASFGSVDDPVDAVAAEAASLAGNGTGMWMAAVDAAETFLASWQDELPFGRPLA